MQGIFLKNVTVNFGESYKDHISESAELTEIQKTQGFSHYQTALCDFNSGLFNDKLQAL